MDHKLLSENESSRSRIDFTDTGFYSSKASSVLTQAMLTKFLHVHIENAI